MHMFARKQVPSEWGLETHFHDFNRNFKFMEVCCGIGVTQNAVFLSMHTLIYFQSD